MLLSESDSQYLHGLRDATEQTLRRAIGNAVDVALLDAPNQTNVGDSLIWAGEMAYLRRMGFRLRYVADMRTYDPAELRRAMPSGVVLLHGGGNFGDLWLGHQNHRERIAKDLPDYRLVQLPQSIYFGSPERAVQADAIIGAHPDFHLLLRDSLSIERASNLLPSLTPIFCHDMALGYEPPATTRTPSRPSLLIIARQDKEAMSGLHEVGDDWIPRLSVTSTDWHSKGWLAIRWQIARRAMKLQHRLVRYRRRLKFVPTLPQWFVQSLIASLNDINIAGALRLYSSAQVVVVDRLHAHVLAVLLGMNHVALDNNYRKIGAVFEDYTGRFTTARYATDTESARQYVEELTAI
ncbi:polysaccharide pyruvyl transferase family protein [Microterricola viridarii]|uniref:Exopolysaccharide biosynthesis protein EpsI, predicted pyruvyl transferase n=1 Tax=Microterricola viridarii TaxID=412690 RepID=A0A1H1ZJG1_9MICO|nr:polysaccharide pyruvyl transferase family protein [Microterricola viridarii]SDT33868.1 Exopolysaccharide biosynthesis protein EpsI, predicted pyruvyl transferase [Microterricola viridarii]